jgi:hypothetical protein
MKKFVLVCLAAFCAIALALPAQASGTGFKAGFSLARISETSGALAFDWKDLPFVAGGLAFESGWGLWGFELDVFYVQQGGKITVDAANWIKDRYHYIQVPAQIKVFPIPTGMVRPFVAAGAYGAYLIRANEDAEVLGVLAKTNVTADFDRWDWGVLGSAGIAFKMPGVTVSVEARYNRGLMNILKNSIAGDSVKNRCWMALVGINY